MKLLRWLALFAAVGTRASAEPRYVYETTATPAPDDEELPEERAASTVRRSDLDRRLPRSAPDALRWEPGVFVQQTGHGQGSAFIRGLTGQQTLMMFDGIRLNNSTYRQGPNQYFFTLDARSIESIVVQRGGSSTRFGSDALGGVIDALPIQPPTVVDGWIVKPRLFARGTTADSERGGRLQVDAAWARGDWSVGFVGGAGAREVGPLEGRPVLNPTDGNFPVVPRYEGYRSFLPTSEQLDLRVQHGTGFKEVTGDGRVVARLGPDHTLTVAAYLYRQYDAPRTDQCPPKTGIETTCLTYDQQFRHLAYASWEARLGRWARQARVALSWQQQHELRRFAFPSSHYFLLGSDDVDSFGVRAHATTSTWRPRPWAALSLTYGLDTYHDRVRSTASVTFTDAMVTHVYSRGQYLDRSSYYHGGAFVDGEAELARRVTVRAGGRFSWMGAHAVGEPQTGSLSVDRGWQPVVGHAGVEVRAHDALRLLANVDHSFRAPNLDDLTSRQQTGSGFQFENPNLGPERTTTFEVGARLRTRPVIAEVWAFETLVQDAIVKLTQRASDCPADDTLQCQQANQRLRLVNAPGIGEIRGVEAAVRATLPWRLSARATFAYTWGETPNAYPDNRYNCPSEEIRERVPYTRIPPVNGTVEVLWQHARGLAAGAGLRWAGPQDRLAQADCKDSRIPVGGTPGFAVLDLRASYRAGSLFTVGAVLENLFDSPYRYHGSSVNGAGRGFLMQLEVSPF